MPKTTIVVFLISVALGVVLTGVVRRLAPRFGLLDYPDGHRKLHARPVALGGGVAVFLAALVVIIGLMFIPNRAQEDLLGIGRHLIGLLVAGTILVGLGLLDDRFQIRGRLKLCGQIGAASVLVANGLVIHRFELFGSWNVELGLLAVPFTLFWLLGAINAMNLLDGMDGLATVLGAILVGTIAGLGLITYHHAVAIIGVVFAGSLIGFLRYNFPPASIYLGDAGSMLIGLVVGVLAILGSLKASGTVLLAAPLAVWTIPILDSSAAILRRRLTGRSIYTTDRGHLHHRLLDLLGSNRKVLGFVAVFCALTSTAALVSAYRHNDLIALLASAAVVVILVVTGIFGRAELRLLTTRIRQFGWSLFEKSSGPQARVYQRAVRLQGTRPWESLWTMLTTTAAELGLKEIRLDVNLPRVQEGYHAYWEFPLPGDHHRLWKMEIPLILYGRSMGSLMLVGEHAGQSAGDEMRKLLDLLDPFEEKLLALTQEAVLVPMAVATDNRQAAADELAEPAVALTRQHPK